MWMSAFRTVLFIIQWALDTDPRLRISSIICHIHYDVSQEEEMCGSAERLLYLAHWLHSILNTLLFLAGYYTVLSSWEKKL